MSNRKASICQAVETSSMSRVRREGTIETSSRSYPRRAKRLRPISTVSRVVTVTAPGGSESRRSHSRKDPRWTRGSPTAVVRGFDGHLDVVRVALHQAGRGDPGQLTTLLQVGDGLRARIAHGRAQPADELVRDAGQRTAVGHLALDALGDELRSEEHAVGEVAVAAEGLVAALLHRAQRPHAAVGLVLLAVDEDQLARRLLDAGEQPADHHRVRAGDQRLRSEEHTTELQS